MYNNLKSKESTCSCSFKNILFEQIYQKVVFGNIKGTTTANILRGNEKKEISIKKLKLNT